MKMLPLLLMLQNFLQFSSALAAVGVNTTGFVVHHAGANNGSSSSPWIKGVMNQEWRRRRRGCRYRPWICNIPAGDERGRRRRRRCCRNRCIDVYSDVNHCGFCRRRCPFGWSCCARRCVDTRFSRRNCGRCFNRCPRLTSCYMGMCGYADELISPNMELPQPNTLPARLDQTPEPDLLTDDYQQLQPPAAFG